MSIINDNGALGAFCERASRHPYITIDTEFLREKTYYSELCLVQMAYMPASGEEETADDLSTSAVIDMQAAGLDPAPMLALFRDPNIIKVFHAARQDLEIFHHQFALMPEPFFDTQIAAMASGFGEQVGYETLVRALAGGNIDKSSRFTDWSARPLSETQIAYARSDVTYLREIYEKLASTLETRGRMPWVEDEFAALLDPKLYENDPEEAWRKLRFRSHKPRYLANLRELASFREHYAQSHNIPRGRVFKDDLIFEIAAQSPKSIGALKKLRLWRGAKPDIADGVMEALSRVRTMDEADYPRILRAEPSRADESLIDLLKVLLKAQAARHEVAPSLIASASSLDALAVDPDGDHEMTRGWRGEIFGDAARALINGEAALCAGGKFAELVAIGESKNPQSR